MQLPEDNALDQATQAPNPLANATSPNAAAVNGKNTSRDSETAALGDYVWKDPNMRICQLQPLCLLAGIDADDRVRVHSIILSDCGQPDRDVVVDTSSGSGGCLFDVLVTPDCTLCHEGADRGFDHRIPRRDDGLSFVVRLLYVSGHNHVGSG